MSAKAESHAQVMLDAALAYAREGIAIVALHGIRDDGTCTCGKKNCPSPGKHPRTRNGLDDATTDEKKIRRMKWSNSNIGGVGVEHLCVDVDPRAGGDKELRALEAEHDELPRKGEALTGLYGRRRGRHFWYLTNGEAISSSSPRRGIQIKSGNGYAVLPPSRHASGVEYEWARGPHFEPAPDWLLELALNGNGATNGRATDWKPSGRPVSREIRQLLRDGDWPMGEQRMEHACRVVRALLDEDKLDREAIVDRVFDALERSDQDDANPWRREDVEQLVADLAATDPPAKRQEHRGRFTDLGNAERFAQRFSDELRYVRQERQWIVCEEGRWRRDETGAPQRAAKQIARDLFHEVAGITDPDDAKKAATWATKSQEERRLNSMLSLASTEPEIVLRVDDLDRDPWVLACGNGTLDLRSGELRPHAPGDLITRGTDVSWDPDAKCRRWLRFLKEVFDGDEELIAWMQRYIGYCLTGDTREQNLAVFYGEGGNGKSTFIDVIKAVLGEHALTAAFDTFMRQRPGAIRNDLARFHRARMVVASESNEGRHLDEATVKEITGGGDIAVRFLYREIFEFTPEFKVVLVTNHRPRIEGTDEAIWRRIKLIPFQVDFYKRGPDRGLKDKLLNDELAGVLRWAVEGCLMWQKDGLGKAEAIESASRQYRQEEDMLGVFLNERCDATGMTESMVVRDAYNAYRAEQGEESEVTTHELGRGLAKRGIKSVVRSGRRCYPIEIRGAIRVPQAGSRRQHKQRKQR